MKTTNTTPTSVQAPAATETYAAAYARLAGIAEKLRAAGTSAAVDDLVSCLQEARGAAAICRARLEAIRREVDAEVEAAKV